MTQENGALVLVSNERVTVGQVANAIAAKHLFQNYRDRVAQNTMRSHDADLALFAQYLQSAGYPPRQPMQEDPSAWQGITWGVVAGFVEWLLQQGYAIGSVNRRLSTVKRYAGLAMKAGEIPPDEFTRIEEVHGYSLKEARRVDARRERSSQGRKKHEPTALTAEQAILLKQQPDTPQGRRDALLMCLLLDHGLRCGEIAALLVEQFHVGAGTFTFYREKVSIEQTHRMTFDTLRAFSAYKDDRQAARGPLWYRTQKGGKIIDGTMSTRAIFERVRTLGQRIGLDGLSPHDARHYWATAAVLGGTDVKALQDAGGWNSPAMPLRYVKSSEIANDRVTLKGA